MDDTDLEVRDQGGRFVKGQSGNPAGRPKGTRNHIVQLRENTELALRDYLSTPANQKKAMQAIDNLFTQAAAGEIAALKLLFDKILPNAKGSADEESGKQRPVQIQIVNQTSDVAGSPVTVVEGDYEAVD